MCKVTTVVGAAAAHVAVIRGRHCAADIKIRVRLSSLVGKGLPMSGIFPRSTDNSSKCVTVVLLRGCFAMLVTERPPASCGVNLKRYQFKGK